jgi:3-oxoacyl-[acyl-carrier protein] reductase
VLAASRGLGYACARALAQEGCRVVMASRDAGRIEGAAARLRQETGSSVEALVADLGRAGEAEALVAEAVQRMGGLDILVHNAGGPPAGDTASITPEQWQQAFEANLMSFGAHRPCGGAGDEEGRWGRSWPSPRRRSRSHLNLVLYRCGPSPGGGQDAHARWPRSSILVNVVAPAHRHRAHRSSTAPPSGRARLRSGAGGEPAPDPLGRLGRPEELGAWWPSLRSEAASYVTRGGAGGRGAMASLF